MKDRAFLFILATLMIDAIGIGIVFPIMPDLMDRVGAASTAQGSVWAGLTMAAYAAMMFLCGPAVGSVSDAVGRKPVLLVALALLCVDYIIMALADTFWLLLVGRLIAGMAGSTYLTATAYIADISAKDEKAARFGMIGAAFGIGFVLGPVLGGFAATIHISAPFWIAALLAGANVVFGLAVLPESLPAEKRRRMKRRDINPFTAIFDAFRLPGLALPLVCLFAFEFANMVYATLWAFWTREVFGFSTAVIGLTLALYGVLLAAVQGGLMPRLIRRFGEFRTLCIGLTASVVSLVGFGFTNTLWGLGLFMILAALPDLTPPLLTAVASNQADDDRQGMVQGVIASLSSVAAIVAPVVLTAVFGVFVAEQAPVYLPGAPFLMSAVLVLGIVPLALRLGRRHGPHRSQVAGD